MQRRCGMVLVSGNVSSPGHIPQKAFKSRGQHRERSIQSPNFTEVQLWWTHSVLIERRTTQRVGPVRHASSKLCISKSIVRSSKINGHELNADQMPADVPGG